MDGPAHNFCTALPEGSGPGPQVKEGTLSRLPEELQKRLEDRFSLITDHLDRFWCHHAILKNNIMQYDHIPESNTLRITFSKEECGCQGQLLIDANTLAALTPFYPAPFRKKKSILEVGTDEVGRGCLFGPVTSAAVVWPPDLDTEYTRRMVKDSKALNEGQREEAYQFIIENAISWGVASLDNDEIDRTDILKASIRAMHLAIRETYIEPSHILVDGTQFKFYMDRESVQVSHTCIPKGDSRYYSIAAASIIAKVTRDRWVTALAKEKPELEERYGIGSNKGYGAKIHMDGIRKWGITKWHRRSFKPCRERMHQDILVTSTKN